MKAKLNPSEEDLRRREYQRSWRAKNRYRCIEANREYRKRNTKPGTKRRYRLKVGDRYGRLVVLGLAPENGPVKRGLRVFLCDCGNEHVARGSHVHAGLTVSCGCFKSDHSGLDRLVHGQTVGGASAEYRTWQNIIKRCEDPTNVSFSRYGAVGISICARWRTSFPAFLQDMGLRPSAKHSIDRYPNGDGNYEPGNCRWATPTQQCRNRKNSIKVMVKGETMSLAEACERYSVKYKTAYIFLRAGRNVDWIFGRIGNAL